MSERIVVNDIVISALDAVSSALSAHYHTIFAPCKNDFEQEVKLTRLLEIGDAEDLLDGDDESLGFRHNEISRIFQDRVFPRSPPEGIDRHIWGADYDRHLRSLRSKPPSPRAAEPETRRTRISSIIRQGLLRSRRVLQAERARSSADPDKNPPVVFVPSPFYLVRQILTDPDAPASEVYAAAALRVELLRRLELAGKPIDLTHKKITEALDTIWNRVSTSKPILGGARLQRGELLFLCHHLASRGIFSLELKWQRANQKTARVDRVLSRFDNLFDFSVSRGDNQSLGFHVGFRHHADLAEMPDAGELLNELQGLPFPIEGATPIFHGGIRFASRGEIVAAVSGPAGAGKTSTCLSLAASLAPLGCRTLFLSCEEASADLRSRLAESIPKYVTRSTPLFNCVSLDQLRNSQDKSSWFAAYSVRINPQHDEDVDSPTDPALGIRKILQELIEKSVLFTPFQEPRSQDLPTFARPIIVVDGFHQLFRETSAEGADVERSLRQLIDFCRGLEAVFIFTVASGGREMERLDYLCDLVIELNNRGVESPEEFTNRIFKLHKARRQPAMIGAHLFHLTGPKSFRIKPNVASFSERAKSLRWFEPETHTRILLNEDDDRSISIQNKSQILIIGKGSSGKAGLGLYILHRRPLNERLREIAIQREATAPEKLEFHESRTLVVSFLYQAPYYKGLAKRLTTIKEEPANVSLPNRALVDVIALYPGGLMPEDFLAKVENYLSAAELKGLPYTGVLIDGIHNVFVQYPVLEKSTTFWPQLFNLFRRRGVTVVTTHTEFEVHSRSLAIDFEQAERRSAPLLTVLISAADYVFELSVVEKRDSEREYLLAIKGTLGEDPPSGNLIWDRQGCQIGGWAEEQLRLPLGNRALIRRRKPSSK